MGMRHRRAAAQVALKHPAQPVGKPWPISALRAFDMPRDSGWGGMLREVLRSRGWSVGMPCHSDGDVVWVKEFEAMLRQQTPAEVFGKRGAVEEGHHLRALPLPGHALWLQSAYQYRTPGKNSRITFREDFGRLV